MNQLLKKSLSLTLGLFLLATPAAARDQRFWAITSGDSASGLYELAQRTAARLNRATEKRDNVKVYAQLSVSSNAALTKLSKNLVVAAVVPGLMVQDRNDLRAIANLQATSYVFLVRPQLSALSIETLRGQRVAVGLANTDDQSEAIALLNVLGLPPGSYQALSYQGSAQLLQLFAKGRADAVVTTANRLDPVLMQALQSGQLQLLQLSKGEVQQISARAHYLARTTLSLPGGSSYTAITSSRPLLVRANLSDETVTMMLELYWKHEKPSAAALEGMPVGLHPAAEKFYHPPAITEVPRVRVPNLQSDPVRKRN